MSFKRLDPEDFVFEINSIASPAWSNNSSSLINFYTSSIQSSISSKYYSDIYGKNADPDYSNDSTLLSINEIQFSIAYGDIKGSGSSWYNPVAPGLSPSRTVYGQFINLLFGEDENASFDFGGPDFANECFLAIVINRARYKQAVLPGSLQLGGLAINNIRITDNSRITPIVEYTNAGRRYTLGSGSFGDGIMPTSATNGVYGYLYPDVGIIILNIYSLIPGIWNDNPDPRRPPYVRRLPNFDAENSKVLQFYLNLFTLQSEEIISSNYIFCRARNADFNYSVNPSFENSFYSSSLNEYIQTPSTYITSVGMYNDSNELLATAKLSKPLKKEFDTEALIRVKLDF
jgi:hypothetical protein